MRAGSTEGDEVRNPVEPEAEGSDTGREQAAEKMADAKDVRLRAAMTDVLG
jgi:hypothetical protein